MPIVQWVRIGKYCSNKGCRRVGSSARKVSNFWIVLCYQCIGKKITLDMAKIPTEGNYKG